jgi:hypothetical protein
MVNAWFPLRILPQTFVLLAVLIFLGWTHDSRTGINVVLLTELLAICVWFVIFAVTYRLGAAKSGYVDPNVQASASAAYHVDFVELPGVSGKLGMGILPGRQRGHLVRDMQADLERCKTVYGVHVVATHNPQSQLDEVRCGDLGVQVQKHNMQHLHFGWRDKWVPAGGRDMFAVVTCIKDIGFALQEGKTVLVHCFGGKGRTGTIVVGVLMSFGYSLYQAVAMTRTARPGCIKNPTQLLYLHQLQRVLSLATHRYENPYPLITRTISAAQLEQEQKEQVEDPDVESAAHIHLSVAPEEIVATHSK